MSCQLNDSPVCEKCFYLNCLRLSTLLAMMPQIYAVPSFPRPAFLDRLDALAQWSADAFLPKPRHGSGRKPPPAGPFRNGARQWP